MLIILPLDKRTLKIVISYENVNNERFVLQFSDS